MFSSDVNVDATRIRIYGSQPHFCVCKMYAWGMVRIGVDTQDALVYARFPIFAYSWLCYMPIVANTELWMNEGAQPLFLSP